MLKNSFKYFVLWFGLLALTSTFALGNKVMSVDLKKLSQQLQTDSAHIYIILLNPNVFLIKQSFPADGQFHYFFLQDKNQLTAVSHWLPKVNKNNLIIYTKPPVEKHLANGDISLLFDIDSRPCVACAADTHYQLQLLIKKQGHVSSVLMK